MAARRKRALARVALGLALLLLLGGCWDRTEINDLAIIHAVSVDRVPDGRVRVGLEVVVPRAAPSPGGEGGGGGQPFFVVSAEAESVGMAVRRIQEKVPRRLFWGHMRALVVGEAVAREGLAGHLSFFVRQRNARFPTVIYVVPGQAQALLQVSTTLEPTSGRTLADLAQYDSVPRLRLRDFLVSLSAEGLDPVTLAARVEPAATGGGGEEDGRSVLAIAGLAIFQDDTLVGWLNEDEAVGLMFLGAPHRFDVAVLLLQATLPAQDGAQVSVVMNRVHVEVRPRRVQGRLTIGVRAYLEGEVVAATRPIPLDREQVLTQIERAVARAVEDRARGTLDRLRAMGVDPAGFGQAVHRQMPAVWRQVRERWRETLPDLPVEIRVTANILRTGKVQEEMLLEEGFREQEPR